jgi:histidyl-tRNA synthetase
MKYADRRGSPCVIIAGEDEFEAGNVTIKDLVKGAQMSRQIEDNKSWREGRPAQFAVRRDELIEAVENVLGRHGGKSDAG